MFQKLAHRVFLDVSFESLSPTLLVQVPCDFSPPFNFYLIICSMSSVSTTVASNKLQKPKIAVQSFEDSEQAVDAAIRQVDRAKLENSVGSEKNAVMRQDKN